jgi:hypothetical protein
MKNVYVRMVIHNILADTVDVHCAYLVTYFGGTTYVSQIVALPASSMADTSLSSVMSAVAGKLKIEQETVGLISELSPEELDKLRVGMGSAPTIRMA